MTGDPAEEAERRRQQRDLEAAARHGEIPDPLHVLRVHFADSPPGVHTWWLARWSMVARLASNAREPDADPGVVTDLGPLPWPADLAPGELLTIGTAGPDGRWLTITKGCERLAQAVADLGRGLS